MDINPDCEIELKLSIAPDDVSALRRLVLLREKCIAGPTRRKVFNVYFDTPEQLLRQQGMALRLRRTGGRWLQTLKTAGVASGPIFARGEWEQRLPGPQLDLSLLRGTPLAGLPDSGQLHLSLKPAFTTIFDRTTWLIEMSPGQQVEIALDRGTIQCGKKALVISEVEIELVTGSAATVFDVAGHLLEHIPLRPDTISKAGRGYQLFHPQPLKPVYAKPVKLKHKWRVDEAMQAIVAACLAHFAANIDGARETNDPEYVHQMRVALRRLRSAMHVFRPADAAHVKAELKWLTTILGEARDWDVLGAVTLPALIKGFDDANTTRVVLAAAKQKQTAARAAMRAALVSPRHAGLMLALGRWAGVPGSFTLLQDVVPTDHPHNLHNAGSSDDEARPGLAAFAAAKIYRRRHRLLRDAAALRDLSAVARHQVRIDAKRLRYAVDFFASLFDHGRTRRFIKTLGRLQDILGAANDANVAISLIKRISPSDRFTDFTDGWFAAVTHIELADVDQHIGELKRLKPFWGKKPAKRAANAAVVDSANATDRQNGGEPGPPDPTATKTH